MLLPSFLSRVLFCPLWTIHVAQHFSRTSRHGVKKRTHRVALDWLFVRINMDPKIQLKYVDTKNQLEDKLTKGNFTQALPQRRVRMHQIVQGYSEHPVSKV